MKDRLIEILGAFPVWGKTLKDQWFDKAIERLADHLLANGVIVPPVKVGQTVWFPSRYYDRPYPLIITKIEIYEEETIIYSEGGSEWHYEDFGKTVFLTREEAEKALAERSEE